MRNKVFVISEKPIHAKNRKVSLKKPYFNQDYYSPTVLCDDVFPYVSFYFQSHPRRMKYRDNELRSTYGDPSKYQYDFYWKQSEYFYNAAKSMPIEAMPVAAYYCMLNAVKSYLAYSSEYVDDFVVKFSNHGIHEDKTSLGKDLKTINVAYKMHGVFYLFAKSLDDDLSSIWPHGENNSKSLFSLLYNLPFVHRAFTMTYCKKKDEIEELYLPLKAGDYPKYFKGNDGRAYLVVDIEKNSYFSAVKSIPTNDLSCVSSEYSLYGNEGFRLISKESAKNNSNGSISGEIKVLSNKLRKHFAYIHGTKRLWYLKKFDLDNENVINLNTMTLNMAIMHRVSEIARYKPEQLNRLMKSDENWLLHEYIVHSLDQFLDEISAQITHREIMCVGNK